MDYFLPDPAAAHDAMHLLRDYGGHAPAEASARADRSREQGNLIHFCHWQQVARAAAALAEADVTGTVH